MEAPSLVGNGHFFHNCGKRRCLVDVVIPGRTGGLFGWWWAPCSPMSVPLPTRNDGVADGNPTLVYSWNFCLKGFDFDIGSAVEVEWHLKKCN